MVYCGENVTDWLLCEGRGYDGCGQDGEGYACTLAIVLDPFDVVSRQGQAWGTIAISADQRIRGLACKSKILNIFTSEDKFLPIKLKI